MLSFRMPTVSGRPRASIVENFWSIPTNVQEIICPPMGRLVDVTYRNGDRFRAEFLSIADLDALQARYPKAAVDAWASGLTFPITVFEAWETAAGMALEFGPNSFRLGGAVSSESFTSHCAVGVQVGEPDADMGRFFPPELDADKRL